MQTVEKIQGTFKGGVRQIIRTVGKVPFLKDAIAMYYCMLDRGTPVWAKAEIAAVLGYLLVPMDAIPDVTPLLGFTDDAGAIATAMKLLTGCVTEGHREKADRFFNGEEVGEDG